MKRIITALIIIAFSLPFYGIEAQAASPLTHVDAYKGIVKIYLFSLSKEGFLEKISSGSGVIINSSGLILTNHHVISDLDGFDDSERTVAYQICQTTNKDTVPNCQYTASFVASNKDIDVALLQMKPISGLSTDTSFSYLELATESIATGQDLTILGYPGTGGDTITITKGLVSGSADKNNLDWIKTDAYVSFGNSGGAGIDTAGKVAGITTRGNELGYLLDISSFNTWINQNKSLSAVASSLENRVIEFTRTENSLKTSDKFTKGVPAFSVTKPSGWIFEYDAEDTISMTDTNDENSGNMSVSIKKYPYDLDNTDIENAVAQIKLLSSLGINVVKEETATIGGKEGKKLILSAFGEVVVQYFAYNGNYSFTINYNYGNNDQDKTKIDDAIKTITFDSYASDIETINIFKTANPGTTLDFSNSNWLAIRQESLADPLVFYNKNNKNIVGMLSFGKIGSDESSLTNNEHYIADIKEAETSSSEDMKIEVIDAVSYASIGKNINNALMERGKYSMHGKFFMESYSYEVRFNGINYQLAILKTGENGNFETAISEFNELLETFEISGYEQKPITEEIMRLKDDLTSTPAPEPLELDDISIENNTSENALINTATQSQGVAEDKTTKKEIIKNKVMHARLKGKIMLKVGDSGKAYYIHPVNSEMHYLGRPEDAFGVMRSQGVGIKNSDLEKIPVATEIQSGIDTDGDGLSDLFEDAVGTDKTLKDTDGDGYDDKTELMNNYSPKGGGVLNHDLDFAGKHKGKIFIQIEGKGEAWYVNPNNGKRYFLGRPADAFNAMRSLGLGISNDDFAKMME